LTETGLLMEAATVRERLIPQEAEFCDRNWIGLGVPIGPAYSVPQCHTSDVK
jgi:hypothetical protein